jgi:PAS domain S-box-containing protein
MIDQDKSKQELIEELAEMRRREAQWRSIVANTPVFVCLVDRAGTIQYLNRTVPGIAMEDAIGRSTYEFLKPDYWEIARQCIERVFDTGQPAFYEAVSAGPNGSNAWYETSVGPVHAADQVVAVTLIATDITERKRAEEALREREAQLLEAQEVANLGFNIVDLATGRITTSPILDRIFGIPVDYERTLDEWANLVHPNDRKQMLDYLKQVAGEQKPFDREYRIVRHGDKQVRWVHGRGRLQFNEDGQPISILGTVQDITEPKQAEEALQKAHDELEQRVQERTAELSQSEERYRSLMENIHMGITVIDSNYRIVMLNKGSAERIGGPAEECIGKECFRAFRLHDAVCPDCPGDRAMNTGQPAEVDHTGKYRDGRDYVVKVRAYPIFAADGHAEGFVELIEDIAARKRAEEALAKEHRNLKHLLHASDNERQLIAYEIHDGVAQHLAGAIMQIQAFAHLKDRNPKEAAKAYDAGLTMLQQGHCETRRLIAGVRPPILDESGVVEAVAHLVHELGRDKGPKIESHSRVDFDRLDPTLENAIYRIAQEALTNACKHSKSKRISVSLLQREDRLRIEIRDWGVGFDPKTVPKNHFGLEGIRQRGRLLGGKCSIRSTEGKGTRITVELPVVLRDEEE